jgi:hypothetical protein
VRAPRKEIQAGTHVLLAFGLRQDATTARDHRIGGKDDRSLAAPLRGNGARFLDREPLGVNPRQFRFQRCLVDGCRQDRVRLDARLREQCLAPGALAGQNQQRRGSAI